MKNLTKEFLVGCLAIGVIALMLIFGWLMGVIGPFSKEVQYSLLFGFAGGVEVGSPVRVAGVKVGKVERIEFLPAPGPGEVTDAGTVGNEAPPAALKIMIGISKQAAFSVRDDSRFFINMAGIIGERYVEISPGSVSAPVLADGATVRGVDPPRVDQLLSQGYGVFGRIQEFMETNEATLTDFLTQMNRLMTDANKMLKGGEKAKFFSLVDNLNSLTLDVRRLTKQIDGEKSQQFFEQLTKLIERAHEIDKPALKKFFQEEGIRARIF